MYKQAMSTYLKKETVLGKIDSIAAQVYKADLSSEDLLEIDTSVTDMKRFVENRTASLDKQLSSIFVQNTLVKRVGEELSVHFIMQGSLLNIVNDNSIQVTFCLYQANGKSIAKVKLPPRSKSSIRQSVHGILMYEISGVPGRAGFTQTTCKGFCNFGF